MKKQTKSASLADIARVAGVSTAAVSYALQNKPRVSRETREKILKIARKLGYAPNARLSTLMAGVRDANSTGLLPIAWLNTAWEKDAWQRYKFQSPLLDGAKERAAELGYKLDEFWCSERGITMERLSEILYGRGIEGAILTFPARHFRLNWEHLASVHLGASLLKPKLHEVNSDTYFNLSLALRSLKRLGFRRIGICLAQQVDSASNSSIRAAAWNLYYQATRAQRVPPLFYPPYWIVSRAKEKHCKERDLVAWVKRHKPEVIVGNDNRIVQWLERAGFRVPEDVGVVHLAVDDDVLDWAGIHSRRWEVGRAAVEQVVSLMRNHQFGVPKTPLRIAIRGTWQTGRTLGSTLTFPCNLL